MGGELARELVGEQTLNGYPPELFEVTVADNGETWQYYQWVTKIQRIPVKTVSKQGMWSEEFRHLIFTEQSSFLFELPRRLDLANPTAEAQQQPDARRGGTTSVNMTTMMDLYPAMHVYGRIVTVSDHECGAVCGDNRVSARAG